MQCKDILYFNSYNPCDLSHHEWNNDINKHNKMYYQLKDSEIITLEQLNHLKQNNYNFWIKVVNGESYFHKDCYLIELFLTYINRPITIYIPKNYITV